MVEYIWVDSGRIVSQLRSKTRSLPLPDNPALDDIPGWTIDSCLTYQSDAGECILEPVRLYKDPLRVGDHYLVLCELYDATDYVHPSNHRAMLRALVMRAVGDHQTRLGFEQHFQLCTLEQAEHTAFHESLHPVGGYDCSVGTACVGGRNIAEAHAQACLVAGIELRAWHPGNGRDCWSFQLGLSDREEIGCEPVDVAG